MLFIIPISGIIIPNLGTTEFSMPTQSQRKDKMNAPGHPRRGSPLADALFTSTKQRVLALLFGQPNRSFFVTELMSLADSGRGAVQRELAKLAESGLVTATRVGNQKHYQANHDSPLFEELCSIIGKTIGLQESIRAALEPLAEKISLALIVLAQIRWTRFPIVISPWKSWERHLYAPCIFPAWRKNL